MPRGKTKFDRCVKAVSKRGGAYDPRAVCGAMRARGELNPSSTPHQQGIQNGIRDFEQSLTPMTGASLTEDGQRLGFSGKDLNRYKEGYRKGYYHRGNPAEAAAEAYKRFHGQDPSEYVTVTKRIHYHRFLFSIGDLVELKIKTEDGRDIVTLSDFSGTYLAGNEQAFKDLVREGESQLTQLFIEGGNQHVNLRDFRIDPDKAHEVETLGKAVKINYHAVKVHLGNEGGDAVYEHKFRTTRQGDKHVKLRVLKYPDVIYRVLDEQLEFSGGSYEIRAEGIDK